MRLGDYFIRYAQYTAAILFATGSAFFLTDFIRVTSFVLWVVKALMIGIISVCVIILCFCRKAEFIGLKLIVSNQLIKMRRRYRLSDNILYFRDALNYRPSIFMDRKERIDTENWREDN